MTWQKNGCEKIVRKVDERGKLIVCCFVHCNIKVRVQYSLRIVHKVGRRGKPNRILFHTFTYAFHTRYVLFILFVFYSIRGDIVAWCIISFRFPFFKTDSLHT